MHVYDKIFVSMPMCMIEIEDREDEGIFFQFLKTEWLVKLGIVSNFV